MESPLNSVDFGSHEPWWNTECEESFRLLYEAKTNLEKNPSKENGLALSRRKTAMGRKIAYAERLYATNIQMSQKHCYSRKYGNPEQMERKLKKKKKKTIKSDGTESEGDNLDLTQEMFSLSHYICDQEELVNQMFATIRGSKLDAMLPPVLKSIPLQEIKKLCLHELRGMSKKRILCTINGEAMEGSSDSEEEEEEDKEAISSEDDNLRNTTIPVKRKVADTDKNNENSSNSRGLPAYLMKTIKVEQLDDDVPGDKSTTRGKKSVMELLELQMRARIIKTMLEKGDDGKTLTEDAIVALMGSATQEGKIPGVVKVEKDLNVSQAKSKNDLHQEQVEMTNEVERMEGGSNERTGRRHRGDGGRHSSSHRKDHIRKSSDGKKGSKRQRSTEVREKNEDDEKRSRRDRSSDKRSRKKKKITRKEFEERMKRAKKNRTYRQRKSSEDEGKANALKEKESSKGEQINTEGKVDTNSNSNIKNTEGDAAAVSEKEQGEAVSEKEEGEAASEKEEGEWDSNEEEEGACSPSDISSRSYYSSSQSYSSRSRSRSYSRSWSRSPNRGRGRGRSKSLSRSRSRSKSKERRKRDGGGRWEKKRSRDHHSSSGNKKMSSGIVSLPSSGNQKQQQQKEEEDNWGQSCDIEFVDSEEDFDDNTTEVAKNTVSSKKPLPVKGQYSERASISFSLQKKVVPNITQNVDLDDLPMKSSSLNVNKVRKTMEDVEVLTNKRQAENPEEIIDLDSPKMISDEILISSDSENELKDTVKAKSVRVEKRELVHSAKEFQCSTGKDKSGPGKKRETVVTDNLQVDNRNLATSPGVLDMRINDEIVNQTTSQGTDLRVNDEITNKLSGDQETELDRHITSQQKIDDGTCAVIEGDEENQTEKRDINKKVESEDVNAGGDVETQGNYNIQKSSNTEDNEFIDVETLDTVDKNIDVDTVGKSIGVDLVDKSIGVDAVDKCLDDGGQRTEFSSETGKEDSKEPVQANITVKNVTESEVVTAHGSENKDGLNNSSGIPQEYQTESEPSSIPDGNVSDLNKEVENKEKDSVVSETINTLDKTQENKISKEKKTGKKKPKIPKVKEIVYSGTKEPKFSKQDTVSSGSKEPTVSEGNESASSSKRKCKISKEKVTASSGEKESNISKEETATFGEKTLTVVRKKVTASSGSKEPTGSQENYPSFSSKRKRKMSKEKVIAGSGKKVTRKVKLEHLQESYNEEQESHLQESYEEQKSSLHAERNLQDSENGFSHEISQEMKEACKETTIEIDEECKETQNDEETLIDGETHIDVEAHNDGELEKVEEKQEIKVSKSDEVQQEDTKEIDNIESKETTENFYSGADELTFSDDDTGSKDVVEDIIQDDREVEPIRIDTGLIRKRVTRSRKVEMTAPNKSWTKKEKKKREKMEGIGLLKTTLAENVQSLASKEEEDNQSKLQDLCKEKETTNQGNDDDTCASWGISSISSRDEMSVDSRIHSPKEAVLQSVEMSPKVGKSENNELQEDETSQKRIGQDTEIIGVIETSTDPTTDQMEGIDLGGSSWSMRWLQSEKVQKVVSSSKILSRVRKKIQKKDKATKVVMATVQPVVPQKKMPEPVVPIIGSIEEYERLFGMKAKKQPDTAASTLKESAEISAASAEVSEQPPVTQETEQLQEKCPTFGSDDEGEDSEEEALWSKIIGN